MNSDGSSSTDAADPSCAIVGVGISAGGLRSLGELFDALPDDLDAAFVVAQHVSSEFKSWAAESLTQRLRRPVLEASDGLRIEPRNVYLIPSRLELTIARHVFRRPGGAVRPSSSIDALYTALARHERERAIGMLLSGTGSEGAQGLRQIRNAGGVAMLQSPDDGRHADATLLASEGGVANVVDSVRGLAERLVRLLAADADDASRRETRFAEAAERHRLFALLHEDSGIDFRQYKAGTIGRRLVRRMQLAGSSSIETYVEHLARDADERRHLVSDLLIGVTEFFRDPEAFEALRQLGIARLVERAPDDSILRMWVPACATGEEAYSIAMLTAEEIRSRGRNIEFRLFATDVSASAVQFASAGVYSAAAVADIPQPLLNRYFDVRHGHYTIGRSLRDRVTFAIHNVLTDPPFSRVDLLSCRNVLIYLRPEAQLSLQHRIAYALQDGGVLLLGLSESPDRSMEIDFEPLSVGAHLYRHRRHHDRARSLPLAYGPTAQLDRGPAPRATHRPTRSDNERLYQKIIERVAPPGLILDEGLAVTHVFGDVLRYLQLASGALNTKIHRLLPQPLSVAVTSALRQLNGSEAPIRVPGLRLPDRPDEVFDLLLWRADDVPHEHRYFVFFEALRPANGSVIHPLDLDHVAQQRIEQLEEELADTRQRLEAAVQDLEAFNEELQTTNEELQASNEELHSTNEEIQSVNEELYTVNTEYQRKIDQFQRLAAELEAVLASIEAGVLILDEALRVVRANDRARIAIPVSENDVHRPVTELALRLRYPEFVADLQRALGGENLEPRVCEAADGSWWHVNARQASLGDRLARGVIITFHEQTALIRERRRIEELLDVRDRGWRELGLGSAVIDLHTREILLCGAAAELLGSTGDERSLPPEAMQILLDDPADGRPAEARSRTSVHAVRAADGSTTRVKVLRAPHPAGATNPWLAVAIVAEDNPLFARFGDPES